MSYERDIAESYRVRAEALRTIAEIDEHSQTREALERVARDYERMAASMDKIAETHEFLGKTLPEKRNCTPLP
jgi:hypothetical protein